MSRKLIRPKLANLKPRSRSKVDVTPMTAPGATQRKQVPPEQTNAENFYYLKQMSCKTPMVVVMCDGEELQGVIEWYDRDCFKINRTGEPSVVVMKRFVKYMYKERERRG